MTGWWLLYWGVHHAFRMHRCRSSPPCLNYATDVGFFFLHLIYWLGRNNGCCCRCCDPTDCSSSSTPGGNILFTKKSAASACLWYRYGEIRFFIVQRGRLLPSGFVSHHRETSKGDEAFRRIFRRCLLVETSLLSGVTVTPQVPFPL